MSPEIVSVLYIVGLFALLWFLFIRPQQKRQKEHNKMINELQVNDEVTTVGGILATVVKIKEDTVVLRLADNVRVEFLKTAVGQVRRKANEPKDDDD
ncbi:preprotein translocase subunit YajC [Desulfofalx alkaliphila]|uniref:preprotein translocase subunit YajC n=1 Tax=Desulfofalx alkaliphila TaxID=105483 RepID=UPI000A03A4A1|nr:preprotein translocase subunit YajC [Desulfofalx alkaliphila]